MMEWWNTGMMGEAQEMHACRSKLLLAMIGTRRSLLQLPALRWPRHGDRHGPVPGPRDDTLVQRHCEERRDEAISLDWRELFSLFPASPIRFRRSGIL